MKGYLSQFNHRSTSQFLQEGASMGVDGMGTDAEPYSSEHTWTLDKTRILDALEGGICDQEIFEFLESMSSTPIPDNVRLFIDDTVHRASLVSSEGVGEVFHVADAATALLILHDRSAKSLCRAAGPQRLLVASSDAPAFRRALRQMGFIAPKKKESD